MAAKQFVVVVYVISVDARRTELHTALLDYATPVQYSVFECWLSPAQLRRMRARVARIVRPRKDHVRYYLLCADCTARVETTIAGEITKPASVVVV